MVARKSLAGKLSGGGTLEHPEQFTGRNVVVANSDKYLLVTRPS